MTYGRNDSVCRPKAPFSHLQDAEPDRPISILVKGLKRPCRRTENIKGLMTARGFVTHLTREKTTPNYEGEEKKGVWTH